MPSKRQRNQWENARAASLQTFKKRRQDSSSLPNLVQPLLDDNEADTSDTNDTEGESETWFWHESANESHSDSEEEGYSDVDVEESNLEGEQPSHEGLARLESEPREIRWNKEGGTKLRGGYGKGSRATLTRKKKSARELKMEASKTYKLGDLWQRHSERIASTANAQDYLAFSRESGPISRDKSTTSLSDIPRSYEPPLSEEEIKKNLRVDGLKDLSRLLKLVSEQEKKYRYRLSPHSNFFYRHLMVQQFLQLQLKTQPSPTRRALSIQVAQAFG